MNYINSLNLTQNELSKPLYRIFSVERFFKILNTKTITLVRPHMWEDPFENYLYKFMEKKHSGSGKLLQWYGEHLFGQCWTLHRETDAMWRIYSPNKNGVRVKSSFQKLYNSLSQKAGRYAPANSFIGKVQYLNKEEIKKILLSDQFIKSIDRDDTSHKIALSLLLKRKEFRHEKEVRLIHDCWDRTQIRENKFYDIDIDPNHLFDSVTIDPRIEYSDFKKLKNRIKSKGFNKAIYRSRLYSLDFN